MTNTTITMTNNEDDTWTLGYTDARGHHEIEINAAIDSSVEYLAECVERQWLNDYAPHGIDATVTIRRDGLDRGTITIRDGEITRWRAV